MERHTLVRLWDKFIYYLACIEAGRKTQVEHKGHRKALLRILPNTTKKPRDSKKWQRRKRPLRI